MSNKKRIITFNNDTSIISYAGIVGPKEKQGPLGECFDYCFSDSYFGEDSWEKAESKLLKTAVITALDKGKLEPSDIDIIFAGDLLNQCVASSLGIIDLKIPFSGMYGACSTMALSLLNAAISVNSSVAEYSVAATSSHFCSAERQYRFPLEYGGVRPPTSQWTVTGSGAVVVGRGGIVKFASGMFGKMMELGITDANNMGAAMAPDDVKIRPYPTNEGMVFFYTQIYIKGGLSHYI